MHSFRLLLLVVAVCCLYSCRSKQQVVSSEPVILHDRDSIETRFVERLRVDTVRVNVYVPAQSAMQTVRDSVSFLETDFAWSRAWIGEDGSLGHRIENKPQALEGEGYVPVKDTESDRVELRYRDVPVRVPVNVEVEKKLSLWQQIRLTAFWPLAGFCVLLLLWIFRKRISFFHFLV